ncbi:MAG: YczE/YyaS/YitT family protein [Streptosporangiaceae bacterium]
MLVGRRTPHARARRTGPLTGTDRLPLRLLNLYLGLVLFGVSLALMVSARLGLGPWDVFHQGLAERLGVPLGWVVIGVGVLVLVLWVPLRQRPGFGTVSNVVVVGLAVDGALAVLPEPRHLALRAAFLVTGVVANGVATGLYIGAGLGPGPRDGLMTGLAARGHSVRVVRTSIELSVLAIGWLLGGTVGVGTVLYAVSIGPLVHYLLPRLTVVPYPPIGSAGGPGAGTGVGEHERKVP